MKNNPIYQAQCFGNIEPIEYMVPYPNLRSLIVGQCIKFSDNILYRDIGMTNGTFLKSINKFANWLLNKKTNKNDRVFVTNIPSPVMEILSYAIWSLGATLVIADDNERDTVISKVKPKLIIDKITKKDKLIIDKQSEDFIEINTTLLLDEAVIYFNNGNGIRLSHYNLLINTYGVQRQLNILYKDLLRVDIPLNTSTGIVLKTILPLYSGTSISEKSANITFSTKNDSDYQVKFDWENLKNTNPQCLYVLPEATAILAFGTTPNHLVSIISGKEIVKINGHSVMMGYLDDKTNNKVFKFGSLVMQKCISI
ncbi:MAG: hypothetical protein GWP19_01995 [Planctomycetia bacterium]|nr:hypothetical protein [Planctomycetia bacterium]